MAIPAEPPSLDPQRDPIDARARDIAYYVYESLAQPNPQTGEPTPRLAKSWDVSADGRTYTFHLRPSVVWHDGAPFTADDVVYTFDYLRDPKTPASGVRSYVTPLSEVIAVDALTVRFTLKEPYWFALRAITDIYIYPKHLAERFDRRAPIGLGKFRFKAWKVGAAITLTRFEDYFGAKPAFTTLAFEVVSDATRRMTMARRGEIDVIERLTPDQWNESADLENSFERLHHVPDGIQVIGWNTARPVFADVRLRRALTMLIDRYDIVTNLRYGLDSVADSWFYPDAPEHDATLKQAPYDIEGAKRLLEELGRKNGMTFTFLYPASNPFYDQLAATLVHEMGLLHIEVRTERLEWAAYTERLRKHDFDACGLVWRVEPNSDPSSLWHSRSIADGSNWLSFSSAKADALLDAAHSEMDHAKRTALYRQFASILSEELPATLLFNRYNLSLVSKRFRHGASTPYGLFRYDDFVPL
ncbi:MAG: hypothetical protein H7Z43_07460 [Clostridia bacterium]|nr:hypothetical protein [Deltaproteobacteria bacterium]